MIAFLRRYRQTLIISVFLIFLVGIFVGLGGYFFTGMDTTEAVAVVGGEKISYLRFRTQVNHYLDQSRGAGSEVTQQMAQRVKQEMLRDMIVNEILAQQADKMGLHVSNSELALSIQQSPGFQRDGRFDQDLYFRMVRSAFNSTPEEYERHQRRTMLSAKLKTLLFRGSKLAPAEVRDEYLRSRGSIVDFEAERAGFAQELQQKRALDAINFFLRQLSTQVEIRSYLEQRERGM
ncbi:MAG: SurA N-terminal domain-containing protein [Elusimicrobiota bacterium]